VELNVFHLEFSGVNVVELELERLVGGFISGTFSSVEVEHNVQLIGALDVSEESDEVFEEVINVFSTVGLEIVVDFLMVADGDVSGKTLELCLGSRVVGEAILSILNLSCVVLLLLVKLSLELFGILELGLASGEPGHELLGSRLFGLDSSFNIDVANGIDIKDDPLSTANLSAVFVIRFGIEAVDLLVEDGGVGMVDLSDVFCGVGFHCLLS